MVTLPRVRLAMLGALVALGASGVLAQSPQSPQAPSGQEPNPGGFRFRAGVDLINVSATVTDASGRFVPGLHQDDFVVYEDGVKQEITHFSAERVPVSLGLVIDTSTSMAGEKWDHATQALDRFLLDLLEPQDEVFLYRFSNDPVLVQDWTTDRVLLSHVMRRIVPRGGTAMYDALAEAVPLADTGHNRKKAIVVISDGNDNRSQTSVGELKHLIRNSEVMVYAVGIDGDEPYSSGSFRRPPTRLPFPFPQPRTGPWQPPTSGGGGRGGYGRGHLGQQDEHVNETALREITDDTGGRTEIIETSRDLDPATTGIADELTKQYFIGYPATAKKDGQWHTIRVEVKGGRYQVRARRGYVAS
jgi:Ca-activated chloride channel family protein